MDQWKNLEEELRSKLIPTQISEDGKWITMQSIVYKGCTGNTEWWDEEDWDKHKKYIKELEENGEYLKPEILTIKMQYDPISDGIHNKGYKPTPMTSYSYDIIDFSNLNK